MNELERDIDVTEQQARDEAHAAALIGRVLRISVIAASILVVTGLLLVVVHPGPLDRPSLDTALGRTGSIPALGPRGILDGILHGRGQSVIQLGLLVLIISPSVRVAVTVLVFIRERRYVLAQLAGFVLLILLLGLVGIGA